MSLESSQRSFAAQGAPDTDGRPASEFDQRSGRTDLQEAERHRADTYGLLARLFRAPPDQPLLDRLAECSDGQGSRSALAAAWAALAEAARSAEPAALDDEFHALFIGLGRGEVLPYASWYLSGFLLDKPLAQLRTDLNELGIERAEDVSESEDHFAALCETMVLLVDPNDGIGQTGQKRFFDRHVHPWVQRFLADVRDAQSADFYRHAADLGREFFAFEESWLSLPQ